MRGQVCCGVLLDLGLQVSEWDAASSRLRAPAPGDDEALGKTVPDGGHADIGTDAGGDHRDASGICAAALDEDGMPGSVGDGIRAGGEAWMAE